MASSNLALRALHPKQAAGFATIAIAGVACFFVTVVVLHVLRPEYDPARRVMSNYAVGAYGFLMIIAFLALAMSEFALALGLYRGMMPASQSQVGMILLGIAGMGTLLAALFPTDVTPDDSPVTTVGVIHILASVSGFLCLLGAMFLLSRRFKKDEQWQSFSRPSAALARAALLAFIVFLVIQAMALPIGGIAQRMLIATFLLWILLTAARLRALASEVASA